MPQDIQKKIKKLRSRSYLARDFDSFKADLFRYARTYFPDQIQDFSEASMGGLLLEMAAYVGDTMSYYLDHQFNELFPSTAIETNNILRHLRTAGVTIGTVSPASARVTFYVEVEAKDNPTFNITEPNETALPVIQRDTSIKAANGTLFYLTENLDFTRRDRYGNLLAGIEIATSNATTNLPTKYKLSLEGDCVSGKMKSESFQIPAQHVPFREITLSQGDVSSISSVVDSVGNVYYEVNSLTEDIVFTQTNVSHDFAGEEIFDMGLAPAPRRFVKIIDPQTKLTTLRFGTGNGETLDDDIIPDPSDVGLPLYGKTSFARFSLNPNSLLESQTLGIAPLDTILTVTYLHGGGLSHNVSAGSITSIDVLHITFPFRPTALLMDATKGSIFATNIKPAGGGLPAPSLNELKEKIPAMRQMQSRIVSAQDLLARVYTLPNKFGRVFRASVRPNPNNPLATTMYVISKNSNNKLAVCPDPLKKNLRNYLNEFRLVSDALDIVDVRILNFGVEFSIVTDVNSSPTFVIQQVTSRLFQTLKVDNFQVGQPINTSDIINIIINTPGVVSMTQLPVVFPLVASPSLGREYSTSSFDPLANTVRGLIIPPAGAIFELKYADHDIVGNAS